MRLTIKEKKYSYNPDFQTNPKEWKQQAGAFFRFRVLIGERECFVKRFIFQPSGWDLVQQLVGETQPYLPEIYAATSEIEAGKLVFYLVTEFLEGDILSDLLTHRKVDMLASMASDIIQSLQILHLKGFWFADFCEKNLFWASQTRRFVLIDLDSCEPLQSLPSFVPNTPGYVPGQEFAVLAIKFFINVVGDTQMQFNTLNGKLLNFAQLLFLSAKVASFCEKLRQQPQQAYAPMVKENTLAFFQNKYADNPKFLVAVFQKLKEGVVNMDLLLQICKKLFADNVQTPIFQIQTPIFPQVVKKPKTNDEERYLRYEEDENEDDDDDDDNWDDDDDDDDWDDDDDDDDWDDDDDDWDDDEDEDEDEDEDDWV
jgi:hypothetical protein